MIISDALITHRKHLLNKPASGPRPRRLQQMPCGFVASAVSFSLGGVVVRCDTGVLVPAAYVPDSV